MDHAPSNALISSGDYHHLLRSLTTAPNQSADWQHPPRPVLVVEDEQHIRDLIASTLADEGFTVLVASNGASALEAVREHAPAVIVLDLNMPIMDGRAFLAAYRVLPGPHAPVVLCSAGYRLDEIAVQLDAADVLEKPFDLLSLTSTIHRVIADWRVPVTGSDTGRQPSLAAQ